MPLLLLLLPLARQAWAEGDDVCGVGGCEGSSGLRDTNPEGYYWRRRGGGSEVITSVPHSWPTNFSKGPAWTWPNELDEQVRHSPLIDADKSIYVTTHIRIMKFSEHGELLWMHETERSEGKMTASPTIYRGTLYAMSYHRPAPSATLFALNMSTGRRKWTKTSQQLYFNDDAISLFVYNDTIIFPARDHPESSSSLDGNNQVNAARASDGGHLWQYKLDDVTWNLMVSTPGDGTLLFASQCGGVYRLNWMGEKIWRSGRRYPGKWCGCGGGTLGPNGIFYAEFNDWDTQQGVVSAHRVSDGSQVWERSWPMFIGMGGWQYPGIGRLAPHGRLAVVAPLGWVTWMPQFPGLALLDREWVPFWLKDFWFRHVYLKSSWVRRHLLGVPVLYNIVLAMDAETGADIWYVSEEPWDHHAMAGDEERFIERTTRQQKDPDREDTTICLPDNQGIPLIAGDGTVYASSGHNGDLTAIRDENGNGMIEADEISKFGTGIGFLNGPSLAPGMLVAAPCWGPMYVFKD